MVGPQPKPRRSAPEKATAFQVPHPHYGSGNDVCAANRRASPITLPVELSGQLLQVHEHARLSNYGLSLPAVHFRGRLLLGPGDSVQDQRCSKCRLEPFHSIVRGQRAGGRLPSTDPHLQNKRGVLGCVWGDAYLMAVLLPFGPDANAMIDVRLLVLGDVMNALLAPQLKSRHRGRARASGEAVARRPGKGELHGCSGGRFTLREIRLRVDDLGLSAGALRPLRERQRRPGQQDWRAALCFSASATAMPVLALAEGMRPGTGAQRCPEGWLF